MENKNNSSQNTHKNFTLTSSAERPFDIQKMTGNSTNNSKNKGEKSK